MIKPIIEIKNLSAGYDGHTVLHDVNLSIYERDFLGIIGPNGGGKTTLIKCILGLLKPTGGEIIFHTPEKAPIRTSTEGTSTETSAKNSHQSSSAKSQLFLGYLPQYSTIDRKFPISGRSDPVRIEHTEVAHLPVHSRTERERQTDYRPHGA